MERLMLPGFGRIDYNANKKNVKQVKISKNNDIQMLLTGAYIKYFLTFILKKSNLTFQEYKIFTKKSLKKYLNYYKNFNMTRKKIIKITQ